MLFGVLAFAFLCPNYAGNAKFAGGILMSEFLYLVAEGNLKKYKDGWSKWRTPEQWKKEMKSEPNYELIRPEQLCLETDFEQKETNKQVMNFVCSLLDMKGIAYQYYDGGNKSFHLEMEWQGLELIEPEIRPMVKKALTLWLTNEELSKSFDEANFGNKRMWHIAGTPHRKTGRLKILIREAKGTNVLPQEIVEAVKKENEKKFMYKTPSGRIDNQKHCPFFEYGLNNKIDLNNKQQNSRFSPNAFAYFRGNETLLQKLVETQQQENLTVARLKCWGQYKPEFNCKQIQKFAGSIGKRSICDLCLLEARK